MKPYFGDYRIKKLEEINLLLIETLKRAKEEIIALTESDQEANKLFYPHYIDETLKKATKLKQKLK